MCYGPRSSRSGGRFKAPRKIGGARASKVHKDTHRSGAPEKHLSCLEQTGQKKSEQSGSPSTALKTVEIQSPSEKSVAGSEQTRLKESEKFEEAENTGAPKKVENRSTRGKSIANFGTRKQSENSESPSAEKKVEYQSRVEKTTESGKNRVHGRDSKPPNALSNDMDQSKKNVDGNDEKKLHGKRKYKISIHSRKKKKKKTLKPGKTAKMHDRLFVKHNYHDFSRCTLRDVPSLISDEHSNTHTSTHSDEELHIHPCRKRKGGVSISFPQKLHIMLTELSVNPADSDVVSWQPHGRCFIVHKPIEFVQRIMPIYFKQTRLTSFQRQLNLYGFSRITQGRDAGAYYHELFLRGKYFLSAHMIRQKIKGTGIKAASDPETEPDFYAMTPLEQEMTQVRWDSPPSPMTFDAGSETYEFGMQPIPVTSISPNPFASGALLSAAGHHTPIRKLQTRVSNEDCSERSHIPPIAMVTPTSLQEDPYSSTHSHYKAQVSTHALPILPLSADARSYDSDRDIPVTDLIPNDDVELSPDEITYMDNIHQDICPEYFYQSDDDRPFAYMPPTTFPLSGSTIQPMSAPSTQLESLGSFTSTTTLTSSGDEQMFRPDSVLSSSSAYATRYSRNTLLDRLLSEPVQCDSECCIDTTSATSTMSFTTSPDPLDEFISAWKGHLKNNSEEGCVDVA